MLISEQNPAPDVPGTDVPEKPVTTTAAISSMLGAAVRADFEALHNDFEQANAMALDLQCQLSGKSNEFAELKRLFDKTSQDFNHLKSNVAELREERHRLANESMRASALDFMLQKMTAERDQLKLELETLRVTQATEQAKTTGHNTEHASQIARLTAELEAAKKQVTLPRHSSGPQRGSHLQNPRAAAILTEIFESVDQLRMIMGPESKSTSNRSPQEPEFIPIAFPTQ